MGLRCGIVGLPNVGKSTLFNALSDTQAEAANYPFCTIDPNIGIIEVPDKRLQQLAEQINPDKITPATIEFVDIAGLVKGASEGEGLGNRFLANIRETDAIIHVVRCFDSKNVSHINGSVDPVRDKEIIETELLLKDLETVEKRLDKAKKTAKSTKKEDLLQVEVLKKCHTHLAGGYPARSIVLANEAKVLLKDLHLLTAKPVLYVCNVNEGAFTDHNPHIQTLTKAVQSEDALVLPISAAIEAEIAGLEDDNDRRGFLQEMGLEAAGIHRLIRAAYRLLNRITFFTAGPKEVRAWTIPQGTKAPQAAGTIHSDFELGFIKAEVIKFKDYIRYGSEAACKEAGKIALEGKNYVIQDGDVVFFRFNR